MDQKSPEAFRTISEVADWLGVPTHVLRFWESRFSQVKPVKRAGGRRYYRPSDMELLGGIRKLLHEDGMTIRGVQKLLREQGVKHVAALSPPLDSGPGDRDVTPTDNVVELSDRREAAQDDTIEDAEIVEEAVTEEKEERRFPFDDEPLPAPPEVEPEPAAAAEAEEPVAEEAEPVETPEPVAVQAEDVEAAAPEVETAAPDEAEPEVSEDVAAVYDEVEAEPAAEPEVDVSDPLPEPEAMEFLAHEAEPENFEAEDAAGFETGAAPEAAEIPDETDAEDPMSSPDALAFAAHGAEPEVVEETPDSAEAVEEPAEDVAAEDLAAEDTPEEPVEVPASGLAMPEIDDDPDDDDLEAGPPIAAQLRVLRTDRIDAEIATLQALADRLDEIQQRYGARDGAAGSL